MLGGPRHRRVVFTGLLAAAVFSGAGEDRPTAGEVRDLVTAWAAERGVSGDPVCKQVGGDEWLCTFRQEGVDLCSLYVTGSGVHVSGCVRERDAAR